MVKKNDSKKSEELESRPPNLKDLTTLCSGFNDKNVKYIVIGGMAMLEKGFIRATEDIDFLVDASVENIIKIKEVLMLLPDQAVVDLATNDVEVYSVVRIADELCIDLLKEACGVSFAEAANQIEYKNINGVNIPFPTDELLLKLKQGLREKDIVDRNFLLEKIKNNKS